MDFEKEAREIVTLFVAKDEQWTHTDSLEFIGQALQAAYLQGRESAAKELVAHFNSLPPEVTGNGEKVAEAIKHFQFNKGE